jgi:septal ring factor EnvC (AmiA/AmiB activator)
MTIWTSPLDHHAWLLADRDATIAKLRAEIATAEETIAKADRATDIVQAKLNTELREHAKTKRTLADTRIHVDELERLNERLLENAKRLTSELQRVESVRDAGITDAAIAAEIAGRTAPNVARALQLLLGWLADARFDRAAYVISDAIDALKAPVVGAEEDASG